MLDPTDTAKKLEGHPELQRCDASPCLKAIGQLLDVGYIVRVKVDIAGNSYKTVGRLFSTEGAAPAALPIATESKSCDVCTVAEARAVMLRLADALRAHIEEPARRPSRPRPPRRRRRRRGWSGLCCSRWRARSPSAPASRCSRSNGSCIATGCDENRTRSAVGGVLIGAGAALTIGGTYVTIVRSRGGDPVTGVALAFRW